MDDIDVFDSKYTMDTSVISTEMCPESQQGMFETYGQDDEYVRKIAMSEPNRVWTAIDSDSGFVLVNGWCFVNRVYYMITNEEGDPSGEEYLIDDYGDDDE